MKNIFVTKEEMQEIDKTAVKDFGIPSILLMENAGRSVSDIVLEMLKDKENKKVAVFCGKGNNGGDGLVAARYLLNKKVKVNVYLLAKDTELKNDPLINLKILKKIIPPISIKNISDLESFNRIKERLKETSIIIDAIFGTGLTILVREPYNSIIRYLNKLNIPIVSVDIPSGLDATDGRILGAAIKADKTVTFCLPKKGLLKNEGPRQTGELITCDIGIPLLAIKKVVKQYEDK